MKNGGQDASFPSVDPARAIADAIQNLMASRLGRGFIPLAVLFAWGGVEFVGGGGLVLPLGAVATGGAMLAYGLRIVQRAVGRPHRSWMGLAMATSVIPPIYSLYVLGWRGLRGLALGLSWPTVISATLSIGLGVWVLRSWMRVVEIERLAQIMTLKLDGEGGAA